jgi:hypothetical protein
MYAINRRKKECGITNQKNVTANIHVKAVMGKYSTKQYFNSQFDQSHALHMIPA